MRNLSSQRGTSLIQVILGITLLCILTALALMQLTSVRKLKADDQAYELTDVLDEARQRAIQHRRTFRVEINTTLGQITLINENTEATVDDDEIERVVRLKDMVAVGEIPNNITGAPTATSPIPVLEPVWSNYPLSNGSEKITLRFARSGLVLDTGINHIGTNSVMRGATIYIFTNREGTTTPEVIRAVTVLQASGDTSIFKCKFDETHRCGNWEK